MSAQDIQPSERLGSMLMSQSVSALICLVSLFSIQLVEGIENVLIGVHSGFGVRALTPSS